MRKKSLRQTANHYIQNNRSGCLRDKKQRRYIIYKLIDDLFYLGDAPSTWEALPPEQFHKIVTLWKKRKIKPSTIMNHMTIIREFLISFGYETSALENPNLGQKKKLKNKKRPSINPTIWKQTESPIARVLLGLQIHFGLTLSEAMRIVPSIHVQEHQLWLTREITFNSEDRCVPFQNPEQKKILNELAELTKTHKNLIKSHGYDAVLFAWREAIRALKLPSQKAYRYLYAQQRQKELITTLSHYKTTLTIMDEMGLKSRTSLWGYLRG
ncbi:MAG: hypothetical protein K0U24_03900 [Gammaproteobacteria bacterium]|nr:hypothetical protein [Gammaproteobacteria bacterium]